MLVRFSVEIDLPHRSTDPAGSRRLLIRVSAPGSEHTTELHSGIVDSASAGATLAGSIIAGHLRDVFAPPRKGIGAALLVDGKNRAVAGG